ncbi:MAG: DUF89 domain-containing protein [Candidatus Bathyarchaeia archaeon]
MKVRTRCGYCLIHRGYWEILRSTEDEDLRFEAFRQLLVLLGERFSPDAVPSHLGSQRDRLIRRITGCPDPYSELKRRANESALKMLRRLEALVEAQQPAERLRTACKIACIGNIIEYDVPDHSHEIDDALARVETDGFHIDDTEGFRELLGPGVEVLLLADNAGEIALDRLLVRELRSLGCRVTVAVKGGPSLNDALMEDAEAAGMVEGADRVITTGTDAIGVNLEEASEEFREAYYAADVMVAKGMANWETITEYPAPCPTLFLFRTKCEPVAESVDAPLQRNIAKLVPEGWRL